MIFISVMFILSIALIVCLVKYISELASELKSTEENNFKLIEEIEGFQYKQHEHEKEREEYWCAIDDIDMLQEKIEKLQKRLAKKDSDRVTLSELTHTEKLNLDNLKILIAIYQEEHEVIEKKLLKSKIETIQKDLINKPKKYSYLVGGDNNFIELLKQVNTILNK